MAESSGMRALNRSLANALTRGALQAQLEAVLAPLEGHRNTIVLVTDLEALHPYLWIGAIESPSLKGCCPACKRPWNSRGKRSRGVGVRLLRVWQEFVHEISRVGIG
jgi:hypothetical protein